MRLILRIEAQNLRRRKRSRKQSRGSQHLLQTEIYENHSSTLIVNTFYENHSSMLIVNTFEVDHFWTF